MNTPLLKSPEQDILTPCFLIGIWKSMVDIVGNGTFLLPEIILWSDTVAQSYKGKTGFWPITFQADKILEKKPLFRD